MSSSFGNPELFNVASGVLSLGIGMYGNNRQKIFQERNEIFSKLDGFYHSSSNSMNRRFHQHQYHQNFGHLTEQMLLELLLEGAEKERDMWEQRNTQFQTLVIASTVMLGGGFSLIVEGYLPDTANDGTPIPNWMIMVFSGCLGLGFALLFVSIVTSLKVLSLMSAFMYTRADKHQRKINGLITELHEQVVLIEAKIGEEEFEIEREHKKQRIPDGENSNTLDIPDYFSRATESLGKKGENKSTSSSSKYLFKEKYSSKEGLDLGESSNVNPDHLQDNSSQIPAPPIGEQGKSVSTKRHHIIEKLQDLSSDAKSGFTYFWDKDCEKHAKRSKLQFYFGALFLMFSISILAAARFWKVYSSNESAILFPIFIFAGVVWSFYCQDVFRNLKEKVKVHRVEKKHEETPITP